MRPVADGRLRADPGRPGPSIAAGGGRLDMAPAAYGQSPRGEGASLVTTWSVPPRCGVAFSK